MFNGNPLLSWNVRATTTGLQFLAVCLLAAGCGHAAVSQLAPGDDLQQALNQAKPGDTLVLPAGNAFQGQFQLPKKSGAGVITIQTSALGKLPSSRVGPADAVNMPRIVSPSASPSIVAAPGASHYRFVGIEFVSKPGTYSTGLVELGALDATRAADLPDSIEFDRVYMHGDPTAGGKRGILIDATNVTVRNSYFSDFKSPDQDTQAIAICNTPGPAQIVNNYLEATGENVMLGGCPNGIPRVTPSDITISHNYFFKPLKWQAEKWGVKNLLELKIGRRVRIDGNVLENNWVSAQAGFALQFTVRTDGVDQNGQPFGLIEDISFTNNIVRNSPLGINISGTEGTGGVGHNLVFRNNVFYGIGARLFQFASSAANVTIDHNTALGADSFVYGDSNVTNGFVFTNNIVTHGSYGIMFSGSGIGNVTIKAYLPNSSIAGNVLIAAKTEQYPAKNFFPATPDAVGFVDLAGDDLRLAAKSPYKGKAVDGKDPGADVDLITRATAGVTTGTMNPPAVAAVVNAADAAQPITPGAQVAISGDLLSTCDAFASAWPLPDTLCGTRVTFNGETGYFYNVSSDWVKVLAPGDLAPGADVSVVVERDGAASDGFLVSGDSIQPVGPAIYTYMLTDDTPRALIKNPDGSRNGPAGTDANTHPLRGGEDALLYADGLGVSDPAIPDGQAPPADGSAQVVAAVQVYVNDAPQFVSFAGLAPDVIGFYAVKFTLDPVTQPSPAGNDTVWLVCGTASSARVAVSISN